MWFIIRRAGDLNTNERVISFYKKELWASHILDKAKKTNTMVQNGIEKMYP
jgi:hypothetical protein